jgi:hypothetical protein
MNRPSQPASSVSRGRLGHHPRVGEITQVGDVDRAPHASGRPGHRDICRSYGRSGAGAPAAGTVRQRLAPASVPVVSPAGS